MSVFALLRAELVIVHRVIVLIEPHHHTALIGRVIRHEQVGAVPDEDPFGIKEPVGLKHLFDRAVEPLQPVGGRHILKRLAQRVLIARGCPVITVLVVEALAVQRPLACFGIQMLGRQVGRQGR